VLIVCGLQLATPVELLSCTMVPLVQDWAMQAGKWIAVVIVLVAPLLSQPSTVIVVPVVPDGTTDNSNIINHAIAGAVQSNIGVVELPCGLIKVDHAINLTNLRNGIIFRGCTANTSPVTVSSPSTEILCNTGDVCVDTTGTSNLILRDFTLRAMNSFSNPSTVMVMMGRDNRDPPSQGLNPFCFAQRNHFEHLYIFTDHNPSLNSGRGYIGIYNIAAEEFLMQVFKVAADQPLWFSNANDLGLSSPYQTLQTGCPGSMTIVTLIDGSVTEQSANSSGIEARGGTRDFQLINQHWITSGPNVTASPINFGRPGDTNGNWYIRGQVEDQNAPGAFIQTAGNLDHMDADVATSEQSGSSPGYLSFAFPGCCVITNSRIRVSFLNGIRQPLVQNTNAIIRGGELDLGTTAVPLHAASVTLQGTIVHAVGFRDADVIFSAQSSFMLLDDTGISFRGSVNFHAPSAPTPVPHPPILPPPPRLPR
jgi:hypothetical protein